jgi:uncharacterized protein YcnI
MRSSPVSTFLGLAAIALLVSAHVTVTPRTIGPGGGGDFAIRVPTERPVATIAVRVEFPRSLRVSRLRSKPGWNSAVVKDTAGVISEVTWSGGRIPPGEWDEFVIAGRTSDSTGELVFKAWQTYQGGEVVPWTGEMDNRPAPRVTIAPAPAGPGATPAERWMIGSALLLALLALTLAMRKKPS